MRIFCRFFTLLLCAALLFAPGALATEGEEASLLEEAISEGVAQEDLPVDENEDISDATAIDAPPSIAGLRPLYTTKIKLMTATGQTATIRYAQDTSSKAMGYANRGDVVTIYQVYPSFVLVEFEGAVGYVLRTCIDENCTILDPVTTPAYGVMPMRYVATLTRSAPVYKQPSLNAETFPIIAGVNNRVAIIEFVDGFAKVYYWRSYGYIDAAAFTDMRVVSPLDEPMSADTPIAAFSSFFAYNTGSEGNDGRCKNIVRSCELMTRVMQPGEQLDFNAQIGPYKRSNGYHPAPVLIDGGSQLGYGGGTCQSSSTLYNTVRQLPGITIIHRRPHGPGSARYLPQHTDAAVGNTSLNFIFRNDYPFSIRIVAQSTGEGVLTVQIFRGE